LFKNSSVINRTQVLTDLSEEKYLTGIPLKNWKKPKEYTHQWMDALQLLKAA